MGTEHRVFGCPGSGKSTYLKHKIGDLVERGVYTPEEMLVVSFTRAAAAAMAEKSPALAEENIGTLHRMVLRSMKEYLGDRPIIAEDKRPVALWNERYPEWELSTNARLSVEELVELDGQASKPGDRILNRVNVYRARLLPQEEWLTPDDTRDKEALAFANAWDTFKYEHGGLLDFTDIIDFALVEQLPPPKGIRCAFFDEAQDFTALQLKLVRMWGASLDEYWLAGDDDQAIFTFTGVDPKFFLEPVPDMDITLLEQSYRVPSTVVDISRHFLTGLQYRQDKRILPAREGGKVLFSSATLQRLDPLRAVLHSCTTQGKRIMLLASCGYQLITATSWLRREAIPFHNPYRRSMTAWNPLTPERGVSMAARVYAFLQGPAQWDIKAVRMWTAPMRTDGTKALKRGAKQRIQQWREPHVLSQFPDWFTDAGLYQVFAEGPVEERVRWYESQLTTEGKQAMRFVVQVLERYKDADVLLQEPAVVPGTVHAVKGGEADVVVLFPDLSPQANASVHTRSGYDALRRQFYVAVTRTRGTLILCEPVDPRFCYPDWGEVKRAVC